MTTIQRMIKYVCPRCGSDALSCDATMSWSAAAQGWELAGTDLLSDWSCGDCGDDFRTAKEVELTDEERAACAAYKAAQRVEDSAPAMLAVLESLVWQIKRIDDLPQELEATNLEAFRLITDAKGT